MEIEFWRATKDATVIHPGSCLTRDIDAAREYTRNPGFGGATLMGIDLDVDTGAVLSLVDGRVNGIPTGRQAADAWQSLADLLGQDHRTMRVEAQGLIHGVIDDAANRAALVAAGYSWVVYEDTYPVACVTWVYLGPDAIEVES